jgi:hypothetical protein
MRHSARTPADPYELLLDGDLGHDALSRVLAAVTASGTQDELGGLSTARSAFVAAYTPMAAPARAASARHRPAATRTVAGRLLAAKVVAAVSGITLVGGVAYAATTTNLFHAPASSQAPGAPAQQPTHAGVPGSDRSSTADVNRGGNGPASAAPVRPKSSKTVTPPGKANGHTAGGPSSAHGTPHHAPNPGHQPGVGRSASSTAPGHTNPPNSPKSKKRHAAHPSQVHSPGSHLPA